MVDQFTSSQPRLLSIAYRMLGEVAEAEDVVQEAFIKWQQHDRTTLDNPAGWLTTIVSRLSIDRLRRLKRERESYPGPWLPVPVAEDTAEAAAIETESVSYALLVVLEKLTPLERAVFLLREVFEVEYVEVAVIVDRSLEACRQIFSRAKRRLERDESRFLAAKPNHSALFENFLITCQTGDFSGLVALLSEEAMVLSDGGGKASAALNPITGADKAARFIMGLMRRAPADVGVAIRPLNGQPGLVISEAGRPMLAVMLDTDPQAIQKIFFLRNPDKLRWV